MCFTNFIKEFQARVIIYRLTTDVLRILQVPTVYISRVHTCLEIAENHFIESSYHAD